MSFDFNEAPDEPQEVPLYQLIHDVIEQTQKLTEHELEDMHPNLTLYHNTVISPEFKKEIETIVGMVALLAEDIEKRIVHGFPSKHLLLLAACEDKLHEAGFSSEELYTYIDENKPPIKNLTKIGVHLYDNLNNSYVKSPKEEHGLSYTPSPPTLAILSDYVIMISECVLYHTTIDEVMRELGIDNF